MIVASGWKSIYGNRNLIISPDRADILAKHEQDKGESGTRANFENKGIAPKKKTKECFQCNCFDPTTKDQRPTMFSKSEMQQLKRDFWIAFAQEYPRKWLLYDTKIKDFSFKFYADNKKVAVMLDIEMKDDERRIAYFEKLESLKTVLAEDYLDDVLFSRDLLLENGKTISRVCVERYGIGLTNKNAWPEIFAFFAEKMQAFELFFYEFEDFIQDI